MGKKTVDFGCIIGFRIKKQVLANTFGGRRGVKKVSSSETLKFNVTI